MVRCVVVYGQSLDLRESTRGRADLAFVLCATFLGLLLVPVISKCHFVDLGTLTYVDATAAGLTGAQRSKPRAALVAAST